MMRITRLSVALLGALTLSACLGGGKKVPPTLLTLTSAAPAPTSVSRAAALGQTITIDVPVIPKELSTTRVPPWSMRKCTNTRTPLPHISDREPSPLR